ncbi:MAG: sigma-70 family RNA polymerase sigma factor [Planctomycetes bacterium]|nr:sigma-70 family RNA polymerase sigma factor [Planctomycetota bacterium]
MFGAAGLNDELVRAASEGSQTARDRILEALAPQLRLMVAARLSPTPARFHAAEDVVQEVSVALAGARQKLRHRTVGGLRAYASAIADRKVCDLLRRRVRQRAVRSLDSTIADLSRWVPRWCLISAGTHTPRSKAERIELTAQLMGELGRLEREQREIITLAFFDQLPTSQIAERLGVSRGAACMRLMRAIRTLRRLMTGASSIGKGRPHAESL